MRRWEPSESPGLVFLLDDRVPTELKKAIMQARMDKKLTQSQLAQVSLSPSPCAHVCLCVCVCVSLGFNTFMFLAVDQWEASDNTRVRVWESNSKSTDNRQTGEGSWCEAAREEVKTDLRCSSELWRSYLSVFRVLPLVVVYMNFFYHCYGSHVRHMIFALCGDLWCWSWSLNLSLHARSLFSHEFICFFTSASVLRQKASLISSLYQTRQKRIRKLNSSDLACGVFLY